LAQDGRAVILDRWQGPSAVEATPKRGSNPDHQQPAAANRAPAVWPSAPPLASPIN